jgi:hypothetical protein
MSYTKPGITCLSFGTLVPDEDTNNLQRTPLPGPINVKQSAQDSGQIYIPTDGGSDLISIAEVIIFGNEGDYDSINANDNGSLSIGKLQWRASRARDLLKQIKKSGIQLPVNISNDLNQNDIFWAARTLNDSETSALRPLLKTDEGRAAQDNQASEDVKFYIKTGWGLGILDDQAVVYFADLYNQRPASAIAIVRSAGGGPQLTLTGIYNAALKDSIIGGYPRRRTTYAKCQRIDAASRQGSQLPAQRFVNWKHVG